MKNSCLYECRVMHHRLSPRENRFEYSLFMFCLDLDEINDVVKKIFFISRNTFNLFNFRDKDHMMFPQENPGESQTVKDHLFHFIRMNGCDTTEISRVSLVTNLCTLGYQFNPVSFYFCFDDSGTPVCSVVEVSNTFGEMKVYFLNKETLNGMKFNSRSSKNFYVSPFIAMDTDFHFNLEIPSEVLRIVINDYKKDNKVFLTSLTGKRKALTNWNTLKYAIRFPFITIQVITLIHWQALKLWGKKVGYYKKDSFIELQQDVLKPHKSLI